MKILFLNHLQNAHDSLRNNRMRTSLTVLGIAIGIASITAILSLGGGASRIVDRQVADMDGNIAVVRPSGMPENRELGALVEQPHTASTLSETDVLQINEIENVEAVAPLMLLPGSIEGDIDTTDTAITLATTPDLLETSDLKVREGQMFGSDTADNTAVIGTQLSVDIYGTEHSIGKTFSVRGYTFRVIGVLERTNSPVNYHGVDFDRTALISLDSGRDLNRGAAILQQINIRSDSPESIDSVARAVEESLSQERGGEQDFTVLTGDEVSQPISELFQIIAGTIAAVAGISLIVGGIGIMNIMLVNVAERTREIGVRKALGATHGDIIWQFLIESLILAILGGVTGVLFGYAIAFGVSLFLLFDPVIHVETILTAIGVSALVGVLFGVYPALRAASKDPIESLRHYN